MLQSAGPLVPGKVIEPIYLDKSGIKHFVLPFGAHCFPQQAIGTLPVRNGGYFQGDPDLSGED